ncbi:MAG: hypothetical protein ACTSPI_18255 [Candidatus Heimdallarchaeaceae archaeon]
MKRLSILIMVLMLLPIGLSVLYNPLPILGKVEGLTVPVNVRIKNLRTGVVVDTITNDYDEFLIDWANTPDNGGTIVKYQYNDNFEIRIPICEDSDNCVKVVTYTGGGIMENFNLAGLTECPEFDCEQLDDLCPDEFREMCELTLPDFLNEDNCHDYCFDYFDCDLCDCPACDSCCDICPECEDRSLLSQVVIRKNKRTGKIEAQVTQHKHKLSPKGRECYHSLYAVHSHNWFVHPKGLKDPWNTEGWGTEDNPYKEAS